MGAVSIAKKGCGGIMLTWHILEAEGYGSG